eukprot:XP_001701467.1 predicted protein [Chlamydomonas reinhardtii]
MEASTSSATAARVPGSSGRARRKGSAAGKPVRNGGVRAYGQQYGNELMQPEWMTDVPVDLGGNWGRTVSWLRNGSPLHRFHCALPGGSPGTAARCGGAAGASAAAAGLGGSGDYCLLDCIFHPPNNTYYIQDLLCWRGYALYDCAAEFRQYWLAAKLAEEEGGRLRELLVQPCTQEGLRAAYGDPAQMLAAAAALAAGAGPDAGTGSGDLAMQADTHIGAPASAPAPLAAAGQGQAEVAGAAVDFMRDGLYLLHRQGHYVPGPTPSPLALLWKDLGCSRYLMDTDNKGLPLEHQQVILAYRADRTVATEDDPPVVLGKLPEAFATTAGERLGLKPGRLLRFSIKQGGITFHEGRPCGADLHFEGTVPQRRGRADSFSKIMFQRLARTAPLSISDLEGALLASASAECVLGMDSMS